jgi:hypothetical protein
VTDVERVDAGADRDPCQPVGLGERGSRETGCLRAEEQGDRSPDGIEDRLERFRIGSRGQPNEREAGGADVLQPFGPGRDPRPREEQDLAHRDPHGTPVERVGAARVQQECVDPERGRAAGDRAEVLVVSQALQHGDRARPAEDCVEGGERPPLRDRDGASMDIEAGHAGEDGALSDVDGGVQVFEHRCELVRPPRQEQEGSDPVVGLRQPTDHRRTLDHEQPVLRLERPPRVHVPEMAIVIEALVGRIVDPLVAVRGHAGDSRHQPDSACGVCRPAVRSNTCTANMRSYPDPPSESRRSEVRLAPSPFWGRRGAGDAVAR